MNANEDASAKQRHRLLSRIFRKIVSPPGAKTLHDIINFVTVKGCKIGFENDAIAVAHPERFIVHIHFRIRVRAILGCIALRGHLERTIDGLMRIQKHENDGRTQLFRAGE